MRNLLMCFCMIALDATGQTNIQAQYALNRLSDSGGLSPNETVYGIPKAGGVLVGDFYYDTEFRMGSINVYGTESALKNIPMRYNIETNEIELKYPRGIRVMAGEKVQSFAWENESGENAVFINSKDFTYNNTRLIGFLEIIMQGEIPCFRRKEISFKQNQYIPALNAGDKNTEVIKNEMYLFLLENELKNIKNKRDLVSYFPSIENELQEFMKKNNLGLKHPDDLKNIFYFINSHVKSH